MGGDADAKVSFSHFTGCFNPHPRMGGDVSFGVTGSAFAGFNPHPRMGGDGNPISAESALQGFNPHPRMGGDPL